MLGKLILFRLLAALGVGLSAAALVDYLRPEALFCGLQSGCEAVSRSAYGRPLGVPLPVLGLAAFGGFYLLSLFPGRRALRLLDGVALLAGFAGLALVLIQFLLLRQVCQLCLAVDACALLLALTALVWPFSPGASAPPDGPRAWQKGAWLASLAAAAAFPVLWGLYFQPPPPLPAEVLAEQQPDRLTVVFVTDFSCDHCRETHPALRQALAGWDGPVHFVMLVYPRPGQPYARDAARAYYCAARQGKGQAMAEALFEIDSPNPAACERAAARLGLDLPRFRACLADGGTEALVDQARWIESARVPGLPAIWIGTRRLTGLQSAGALLEAMRLAAPSR